MKAINEVIESAYNLAVEARVRAGMMQSDYRRHNLARTRRAQRLAARLAAGCRLGFRGFPSI